MMSDPRLDALFQQAAENPENTPAFLKQLLLSDIYCLGLAQANGRIQFRMLQTEHGEQAIPFFLSSEMICADWDADERYLSMPARNLLEMTQGAILVLNPTSSYLKEFSADEIEFLLQAEFA